MNGSMRQNEVGDLRNATSGLKRALHDGNWGKATIEVILALMTASSRHQEINLHDRVPDERA